MIQGIKERYIEDYNHMLKDITISIPKRTQIFICYDKPCSKNKNRLKKLRNLLPMAKKTKCMDICKGPVVLVVKDKNKYYCKKIKKEKHRIRLRDFILLGVVHPRLKYKLKKQ